MANVASTLLPKTAKMSTLSKGRNFTIESFDIVAVCGNKVERCFDNVACCFDIVAGVDGVLGKLFTHACRSWQLCLSRQQVRYTYTALGTGCAPQSIDTYTLSLIQSNSFVFTESPLENIANVDITSSSAVADKPERRAA